MLKLILGAIGIKRLQGRVSIVPAAAGAGGGKMQEKTVTPSTAAQVVTPDGGYAGMYRVNVEAAKLQDKIVSPSTAGQTVQADDGSLGLGTVTVQGAPLQNKTVTLGIEQQTITPDAGFYGIKEITIPAIMRSVAVTFSKSGNTITATSTRKDGTTATSEITLNDDGIPDSISGGGETKEIEFTFDDNGYATGVSIDGEKCPINWEGFHE